MTTTATINSDDINSVSFPGSETGLSLVELVGTVSVSGSISSITLRLNAGADTVAAASITPPATSAQKRLSAKVKVSATSSATALRKVTYEPSAQSAAAGSVVTAICLRRTSASTQAVATHYAESFVKLFRGAATESVALLSVTSFQKAYVSSVPTVATATALPAYVLRNRRLVASVVAAAVWSIPAARRMQLFALANATAQGSANEITVSYVGASAVASSISGTPLATAKSRVSAVPVVVGPESSVTPVLLAATSADSSPEAVSADVAARLLISVSASATATVSSAIAAADYSATLPAPNERVMVVPAINRRIEVTE